MKMNILSNILSRLNITNIERWIEKHTLMEDFIKTVRGDQNTVDSELTSFIKDRNEAAHGVVTNVLGKDALLEYCTFIERLCKVIYEKINHWVLTRKLEQGDAVEIGFISETLRNRVIIAKIKESVIDLGDTFFFMGENYCLVADIESMQVDDVSVSHIVVESEKEIGFRTSIEVKKKNAKIIRTLSSRGNIMVRNPQQFVDKWRRVDLKERSSYQEHFADLCYLVGHPTPAEEDPTGENFTYEAGIRKQDGSRGWADVWKKGYFALEYKKKGSNLNMAYQQLLQYREALQNPPLLVVSDMERILIHTNFTNTVKQVYEINYDTLLTPAGFQHLQNMFTNPEAFRVEQTPMQVTMEAARQFATLAEHLRKWKHDSTDIAHFLIRILFCLFAEDAGLLTSGLFSRLVDQTKRNTAAFSRLLKNLFETMANGGWFGTEQIPHINGRLFDSDQVIDLDSDALDIIVRVSKLDWSSIEPAIFGTLFERSLDPVKRSQLGAHYTGKEDILLIVEPVLMAPLRRKWTEIQVQIHDLETQREQASLKQQVKITSQMQELIVGFTSEIAQVKVLDPACGSGNFLYVALKLLLDLEKEVITFAGSVGLTKPFPQVSPEQLRGIEINEYAHELAQITVWIGYIQWLRDNGFGRPSEPILKHLDTIRHMDAILAFDEQGLPHQPEWPDANVIIGNPPFLGGKKIRTELGDERVDNLFRIYDGLVAREADLVTYWFERSRQLLQKNKVQRVGLLATNSIRGGVNRRVLEKIKESGDIFMAWSDRPWILDGAAVHVSMIGFDNGEETNKFLDGMPVTVINPDLTGSVNMTAASTLKENEGISFMGDTKGGPFDINAEIANMMLSKPINPNGRPNSDVVVPWMNGLDITRRPRDMWIIDFGTNMSLNDASLYEVPFQYIEQHVYPERQINSRRIYAERWWIHAEPRPKMRDAIKDLKRFIVTARVAKHRLFTWVEASVIPDSQLIVIASEEDYFLGILHSKLHELWALRMGTSLEDRPRYTPTSTFETFPFPWAPRQAPIDDPKVQLIAEVTRELIESRNNWLKPTDANAEELRERTLTNLYNQRPTWLDNAHKKLDKAVFAAYGWPDGLSNEEILERLLGLNVERALNQSKAAPDKQH
jgi:type II restriction/modification system DNA methylase subunit YeeA